MENKEVAKVDNRTGEVVEYKSFSNYINLGKGAKLIANAISDPLKRSRFATSLITLMANEPGLMECAYDTVISAALQAEAFDLPLNNQLGFVYILPFNNKYKDANGYTGYRKEAQFQVGTRGYEQLALRSGEFQRIPLVTDIKKGELKFYDPIHQIVEFNEPLEPGVREKAETIGYYAFFYLKGNETTTPSYEKYFTKDWMEHHAETYSKGYQKKSGFTFWEKNFDVMADKTALKQILKHAPASVDSPLVKAIMYDQAVIKEDGTPDYIDGVEEEDKELPKKRRGITREPKVFSTASSVADSANTQTSVANGANGSLEAKTGQPVEKTALDLTPEEFDKQYQEGKGDK